MVSPRQEVQVHHVPGEDKKVFSIHLNNGTTIIQKKLSEVEKFYETVRSSLGVEFREAPKKRLLLADSRLNEKRRLWIEELCQLLINDHSNHPIVVQFLHLDCSNTSSTIAIAIAIDEEELNEVPERTNVQPGDFEFLSTVGKGSFGRVYLVRHKAEQKIYAMKVLQKEHIKKRNEVKHVMSEKNVMTYAKHPFLVNLHFSFQTRDKLYFVLDYLNGGELFFHLQREKQFSEPRARFYSAEIGSALGYLHKKNIIYRDLKPENLLLDRFGHVVLTDFGLCKENIKLKDMTRVLKKAYDKTVDWWCLGTVLYEMLVGLPPFYCKDHAEMYERIVEQPLRLVMVGSPSAREILQQLLHKDKSKRLGAKRDFDEIKDHAFFMPIEWDKLLRRELKPPFIPRVRSEIDTSQIDKDFTNVRPNPGSLIPNTPRLLAPIDKADFPGFSYIQAPAV